MMSIACRYSALALAGTMVVALTPAAKASSFFGIPIPIPHIGPSHQPTGPTHHHTKEPRRDKTPDDAQNNRDNGAKENSRGREAALASLGANKNLGVLTSVTFKSVTASAGSDDSNKIGTSANTRTNKVDLPQTLAQFVTNVGVMLQANQNGGDVSVVSVESALDTIYSESGPESLRQFEQMAGDSWSADQFKVDILKVANQQLGKFAVGNTKGLITMAQVDKLLRAAAHDVYVRTFEVSELIAMNKHIVDFDRTLWENSGPDLPSVAETPAAKQAALPAVDDSSSDPYTDDSPMPQAQPAQQTAGSSNGDVAQSPAAPALVSQPSKMSHISSEMVRIAQLLVDDLSADATKGMRDLGDAVRYRLMRATVDCFTRIAVRKTTDPTAATQVSATDQAPASDHPQQTAQEQAQAVANQTYIDLVNSFQKSIEKKDAKSERDVDGECRVAADTLIGLAPTVVADQAAKTPPTRDTHFLREPEPLRAVWTGSDWASDQTPARSN